MTPSRNLLLDIGKFLRRPNDVEWTLYSKKQISFNLIIFVALIGIVLAGFQDPFSRYVTSIFQVKPLVPLPRDRWHVLYSPTATCLNGRNCSADDSSTTIWQSRNNLSDADHFSRVREFSNRAFWVGTVISKDEAHHALRLSAIHMVIGHLNSSFELYVNGELREIGDGRDYLPTSTLLTPQDLKGAEGIHIAIRVLHDIGSARPVVVDAPYMNGLFAFKEFRNLRDLWLFQLIIRPLGLGFIALLSALAFISLWISVRDRNEYFLFAIFTFCLFSIQLMYWGSVKHTMDRGAAYELDLLLRVAEGISASLVGLAYARLRIGAYAFSLVYGLIVLGIMYRSKITGSDFLYLSESVGIFFVPSCFLMGAIACLSQAEIGRKHGFPRMLQRKRSRRTNRLFTFAALNFALSIAYVVGATKISTINAFGEWYRPVQFLLVALMGIFLVRDYREFDFTQQKMVFSRFHDPLAKEQKIVQGFLLAIDLKKSSRLYDLSAQLALATKIPTLWCESATEIVEGEGGCKISMAGDSLVAFFETDSPTTVESILISLRKISSMGKDLESSAGKISFRAAIVAASIRPIYKKIFRKLYEDFEDAPGETSFKNLMRILETEKKFEFGDEEILVTDTSNISLKKLELIPIKQEKLSVRDVGTRELSYWRVGVDRQQLYSEQGNVA